MYSTKKAKVYFLKSSRFRLFLIVIITILVIFTYDYIFFKSPTHVEDATSHSGLVLNANYGLTENSTPLVIKVFYECLCPDSKSFFTKHLLPSVLKIPNQITTILIPYGNAKTEIIGPGDYKFTCQHGELECLGNKIHACVISKVQDMVIQLKLLTCMISDNISPEDIGRKCCSKYNVDWSEVRDCALGKEGSLLLKLHGDKTNSLIPKVKFIPTIYINEELGYQPAILKNLWKELCHILKQKAIDEPACYL